MSVNTYNASTGALTNIAAGQRTQIGTKAAYQAAKTTGTLPNNCLVAITDDEDDTIATSVIEDDNRAVSGGAVFDEIYAENDATKIATKNQISATPTAGSGGRIEYCKVGTRVCVIIQPDYLPKGNSVIFTLPAGYRPDSYWYVSFIWSHNDGSFSGCGRVDPDGKIHILNAPQANTHARAGFEFTAAS